MHNIFYLSLSDKNEETFALSW